MEYKPFVIQKIKAEVSMGDYRKEVFDFVEDSMRFSVAQRECYENLRDFFIQNHGKDPPIIEVIDILHHPNFDYRERRLKGIQDFLSSISPERIWEVAQIINIAKNLHHDSGRDLFIPSSYFYDLKAFFLNLLFIFMLNEGEILHVSRGLFIIEKRGFFFSIKIQQHSEGAKIFLVDLSRKESVSHEEIKRSSMGLHIFPNELDEKVSRKLLKMVEGQALKV